MSERFEGLQLRLEEITRKRVFYAIFIFVVLLPPITTPLYGFSQSYAILGEVLKNSLKPYMFLMPIASVILLLMIVGVVVYGNRFGRVFSAFVGVNYVLIIVLQNTGMTPSYGYAILLNNLVWIAIVALVWFVEAMVQKTDYTFERLPWWRYWVVPLSIIAFWAQYSDPWNYHPILLLTSEAPLSFCFVTPIFLALLTLLYPRVNMPVMRVTSFLGIIMGIFNMMGGLAGVFIVDLLTGTHAMFTHMPLLLISLYCFRLSIRKKKQREEEPDSS